MKRLLISLLIVAGLTAGCTDYRAECEKKGGTYVKTGRRYRPGYVTKVGSVTIVHPGRWVDKYGCQL